MPKCNCGNRVGLSESKHKDNHRFKSNQLVFRTAIEFEIERHYNKLIKIKKRSSSIDRPKMRLLIQERFYFSLEGGNDQIEISDDSEEKKEDSKVMVNNYTEPNMTNNKKQNMLEDYLPKLSNQYQGRINTDCNMNDALGVELNMLNEQYETIKQNLIQLNP